MRIYARRGHVIAAGLASLGGCQTIAVREAHDLYDGDVEALLAAATDADVVRNSWIAARDDAALLPLLVANNPDVRAAQRRMEAAREALKRQQAFLRPALDVTGRLSGGIDDNGDTSDTARGGLELDIPLDVSGQQASQIMAARSAVEAARARHADAARLAAQLVGSALIDAWNAERQLALLAEQVEANRTQLELIQLRFMQGQASIVDVLQQRNQLQSVQAQIPSAQADLSSALYDFSARTGRMATQAPDMEAVRGAGVELLDILDRAYDETMRKSPDAEVVDLLDQRPDILARLYDLEEAEAQFAAALAARLPQASLNASLIAQTASGNFSAALDAILAATWAVFDGGANDALAAQRRASALALARVYAGAYLDAAAELLSARASLDAVAERLTATRTQLENARDLTAAARNRYLRGATDYLPVISAIQTQQRLELQLLDLEAEALRGRLGVVTASGGGFTGVEDPAA